MIFKELIKCRIKPQPVPLVELKCQPEGEALHTFKTEKVYLLVDQIGAEEKGFAICPVHNIEVPIKPIRTKKDLDIE